MSASGWVHLDVQVIRRETEKAFNVIASDGRIHWFPKSQVAYVRDYQAGDRNVSMAITERLAEEKGISDE